MHPKPETLISKFRTLTGALRAGRQGADRLHPDQLSLPSVVVTLVPYGVRERGESGGERERGESERGERERGERKTTGYELSHRARNLLVVQAHCGLDDKVPTDYIQIKRTFLVWLQIAASKGGVLLVIDGADGPTPSVYLE